MMPDGKHPGFIESFGYALQGIRDTFAGERNFKVMLGGGVFAVVMGIVLRIDLIGWAVIVALIALVLCAELLNTAIEHMVDLASPDVHPLAKKAKDAAAAGVFVASAGAAVAGIVVYVRAILALMG